MVGFSGQFPIGHRAKLFIYRFMHHACGSGWHRNEDDSVHKPLSDFRKKHICLYVMHIKENSLIRISALTSILVPHFNNLFFLRLSSSFRENLLSVFHFIPLHSIIYQIVFFFCFLYLDVSLSLGENCRAPYELI